MSLYGPDHIIEPVHQIEIITIATEESHCRVGVTIHKSRYDSQSVPLNQVCLRIVSRGDGADLRDPTSLYQYICPPTVIGGQEYILDQ